MQASWIDPEDIQGFLAQLEGPRQAPAQVAWEVHTLPMHPLPASTAQPLMGEPMNSAPLETPSPQPPPATHARPIEMPLSDHRPGPEKGEIWNIREQLRSLRERAEESGIVPAATAAVELPKTFEQSEPEPPSVSEQGVRESAEVIGNDNDRPSAPPISADAKRAFEELLGPLGPQPESPPQSDPATLPPPIQPPPAISPASIEYTGPAPSSVVTAPLFATSSTSSTPATRPFNVKQEVESVLATADESPNHSPDEAPAAPAIANEYVPTKLGLSDRLHALATWATTRLGTHEVLLVDDYGDVLWGDQQHTALVLAAMMAWHSAQRANAESASTEQERIDKELSLGRSLTVIPVRTRYGNVSLAAITQSKVADDAAHAVREALLRAVEGE